VGWRAGAKDAQKLREARDSGKSRGKPDCIPIYRKLDNARLEVVRQSELGLQAVRTTYNLGIRYKERTRLRS